MLSSQRYSQLHPFFFFLIQIVERLRSVLLQRPQCFDPLSCGSCSLLVYKGIIVIIILTKKSHVLRHFFLNHRKTELWTFFFFSFSELYAPRSEWTVLPEETCWKPYEPLCIIPVLSCSISSLRRSGPDSEITSWRKCTHQLQLHPSILHLMYALML